MVMNTDPSDIEEDIDGMEPTIDIYVLCANSGDAEALAEQLAPRGYRVTLFTESTHLLQTLHDGKPNLLICDTSSPELDGYEFCREVKTDWDLWMIPVLLVTGISGLGDLLKVLDCNADNFIIRPYYVPYLLSVVDSTIATPLERPDPEKIKTQFKIRYDESEYVISADRRKLLELLLSAFEITVQQAGTVAQADADLNELRSTLEQRVSDRAQELSREVSRLNAVVQEKVRQVGERESVIRKKEEGETALRVQIQEQEAIISEKIAELLRISGELEQKSNLLTNAEEKIQSISAEKNQAEQELNEKIRALIEERDHVTGEHERIKDSLSNEAEHRQSLESDLAVSAREKQDMENTIGEYSREIENLKLALDTIKNEAQIADQKAQEIIAEKTRAESALQQTLQETETRSRQQAQELTQLSADLSSEQERRTASEQWIETLLQEKMQREAALGAEKSSLVEQRTALQEKFDATTASLGAERQKNDSLLEEIKKAREAKELLESNMRTLIRRLEIAGTALEEEKQLRLVAEKSHKESGTAHNVTVQAIEKECRDLKGEVQGLQAELALIVHERDTLKNSRKTIEDELAGAVGGRAQSEKLARSISYEMEQIRSDLESERKKRRVLEENLKEIVLEKSRIEEDMQATAAKNSQQITSSSTSLQKLESEMETILARERSLEDQLREAVLEREEKERAFQTLADTCEAMQESLKEEKEKRYTALEDLAAARKALENYRHAADPIILPAASPTESQAVSIKESVLPRIIEYVPQSLATIPSPVEQKEPGSPVPAGSPVPENEEIPVSLDVEDLFEAEKEMDIADLTNPAPEFPREEPAGFASPDAVPAASPENDGAVPGKDNPDTGDSPDEDSGSEEDFLATKPEQSGDKEPETTNDGDIPGQVPEYDDTGEDTETGTGIPEEFNTGIAQERLQFNRGHWFELVKWAHSTPTLSHEEKLRIVRIGRLIQRGGRLTPHQEEQVSDIIALACSRGYISR
ncbi:MAG: response regulator [Methanoregula sp.]